MEYIEDQVYIDKIIAGDNSSYATLVNRYKDMAYTISIKITGDADEAQDAVQESFIKAFQAIRTFKGNSKFSTWLYTIVYRTSILSLKQKRIKTSSITEETIENYNPDDNRDALVAKEQSRQIKQAIAKLPPTEALLITLYYLNESTVKEIAEITGLSLPNIKIQLFRARKRLERELRSLL